MLNKRARKTFRVRALQTLSYQSSADTVAPESTDREEGTSLFLEAGLCSYSYNTSGANETIFVKFNSLNSSAIAPKTRVPFGDRKSVV